MNSTLLPPTVARSRHTAEDVIAVERLRRITVDEYHRMIAVGILKVGEPVELLDGLLVQKMPRNPPHDGTLSRLLKMLFRAIPDGWDARCQMAVTLTASEPEPDIAVVRQDPDEFMSRHPDVSDTAIAIEVSDSSLGTDLNFKLRRYSEENVPVYWVVNIPDRQVEVFSQPAPAGYQSRLIYPVGAQVPVVLDGQTVAVIDVTELFR